MMTEEDKQILEWASMIEGDKPGDIETDSADEESEEGSYECQRFMDVILADDEGELEFNFKKIVKMSFVNVRHNTKVVPNRIDWDFDLVPRKINSGIPYKLGGRSVADREIWEFSSVNVCTDAETMIPAVTYATAFDQLGELVDGDHFPASLYDSTDMSEVNQLFFEALHMAGGRLADWTEDPVLEFNIRDLGNEYKLTVWFEQPDFVRKVQAAPSSRFLTETLGHRIS